MLFVANAAERMRIDSSGSVGIGNTTMSSFNSEANNLVVGTGSGDEGITIYTGSSAGHHGSIFFADGTDVNAQKRGQIRYEHNTEIMSFFTNTLERMRIDSSGNVGIGTTSPGVKLEILGTENEANTQAIRLMENSTQGGFIKYDGLVNELQLGGYNSAEKTGIRIARSDATTYFNTNGSERMKIDSSGRVGIGTSSSRNLPSVGIPQLQVEGANTGASTVLVVNTANDTTPSAFALLKARVSSVVQNNDEIGRISFNGWDGSEEQEAASISAFIDTFPGAADMPGRLVFKTTPNASATPLERMRITSVGTVLMGKAVSDSGTTAGFEFSSSCTQVTRDADVALVVNRLTNDGVLVVFRQNTTDEGNISVSGSTVSYNGFTGTHWSRFTDNSTPTILRGTVLESLDEMCDWYNLEFDVTTTTQDEDGNDVTNTHTEKVPHVLLDSQSNGDVITYNHEGTDVQATIVKEVDIKHMNVKSI
jgi:hypothetical protein